MHKIVKPSPGTLYGISEFGKVSVDGSTKPDLYLKSRYKNDEFGFMKDNKKILYFFDIGHRDEFWLMFGGVRLTLTKQSENTITGEKAMGLLNKAGVRI